MTRIIFALATVFSLAFTPLAAQDYQKGLDAYNAGDYGTALQEWRPLADQGDAWAQFNVGLLYDPVVISQNRPSVADALFFWRMHSRWGYLQIMA
jgi:TPR repeat protein